jgi:hypothetical protein
MALAGCAGLSDPEVLLDNCGSFDGMPSVKYGFCTDALGAEGLSDHEYGWALGQRARASYSAERYREAAADAAEALEYLREPEQRAFAHEILGYAYEAMGDVRGARAELDRAAQLTGDGYYEDRGREIASDAERRRTVESRARRAGAVRARAAYRLFYEGLWCGRIQGDSIAYPANELKVQVFVNEGAETVAIDLPANGVYRDVRPGYRTVADRGPIWQGGGDPIDVSVVVWEHDDGGPAVDVLAFAAVTAVSVSTTPASAGRTLYGNAKLIKFAAGAGSNPESGFRPGLIDGAVGSVLKSAFGTSNDLVGVQHHRDLSPAVYAGRALGRHRGFGYHFYTSHKRGGANCRVYFRFAPA